MLDSEKESMHFLPLSPTLPLPTGVRNKAILLTLGCCDTVEQKAKEKSGLVTRPSWMGPLSLSRGEENEWTRYGKHFFSPRTVGAVLNFSKCCKVIWHFNINMFAIKSTSLTPGTVNLVKIFFLKCALAFIRLGDLQKTGFSFSIRNKSQVMRICDMNTKMIHGPDTISGPLKVAKSC